MYKVLFLLLTLFSRQLPAGGQLHKAQWLLGTWESRTSRGNIYESWRQNGERSFEGRSFMINNGDTVIFESISLHEEKDGLFYSPAVKNQNGGLAVHFKLKTIADNELVFENLQHNFPQLITYTKIHSDSLVAVISGNKNGQARKQVFPMKKISL